ncbi:MAG TPA: tetratricopeptide repeat protein [Solirubrobacterales bacterium]|jgi:DNA-binding MarR family transcriptional regulator
MTKSRRAKRDPLRRRILESLAEAPANPTSLADHVDSTPQPTVRILKALLKDGLVEVSTDLSDRRLKFYEITAEGEVHLNRQRADGTRGPARPDLGREETLVFLERALDRAVEMRRGSNQLDESKDRFKAVIREAEKIEAHDLALKAMAELTKTLRQSREPDAADGVIDRLNAISLGAEPGYAASLALPAAAHYRYALGRLGDRRGDDLPARAEHLRAAFSIYQQLARSESGTETSAWLCQRAWSLVALATNLRKQTQLERALLYAVVAKRGFDEVEDEYGSATCWFMFGFCLRLLGEFGTALACFDRAHEISTRNAFDRVQANSLMQLGDVLRSQGNVVDARVLLNEALEQSDRMGLVITQAFAYSALGAVEFQEENFLEAGEFLSQAQGIFDRWDHTQGKALNSRRRATVARQIAITSSQRRYTYIEDWIETAFVSYQDLESPAGIAACQIENGRVQMLRKNGNVRPTVKKLAGLLSDRDSCKILELDPWVPKLLCSFAEEAQDASLVEVTHRVYEDAQDVLAQHADRSVQHLNLIDGQTDGEHEWFRVGDESGNSSIAEMGGETRRNMASFEEQQILEPEFFDDKLAPVPQLAQMA